MRAASGPDRVGITFPGYAVQLYHRACFRAKQYSNVERYYFSEPGEKRRRSSPRTAFVLEVLLGALVNQYARAYCSLSAWRNRSKYESKVTKPEVPWKNALPPVSLARRFKELCP